MTQDLVPLSEVEMLSATAELTEQAYTMSPDDFAKLKVADRDAILFSLLRELAGSQKVLELKIAEYEQKARELMSPEGIEEAKKKIMDSLGLGGGLFGGGLFG